MLVYRLYITSPEAGSWHIRVRDLAREKLGAFEENSTVSYTKLL
jgi:subtilisin-like proprotein convertase family protein